MHGSQRKEMEIAVCPTFFVLSTSCYYLSLHLSIFLSFPRRFSTFLFRFIREKRVWSGTERDKKMISWLIFVNVLRGCNIVPALPSATVAACIGQCTAKVAVDRMASYICSFILRPFPPPHNHSNQSPLSFSHFFSLTLSVSLSLALYLSLLFSNPLNKSKKQHLATSRSIDL